MKYAGGWLIVALAACARMSPVSLASPAAAGTAIVESRGGAPLPAISIILDDLGEQHAAGRRALRLPPGIACSFLPGGAHTAAQAEAAHRRGHEVLLHLPLEYSGGALYPLGLHRQLQRHEWTRRFARALESVPHARGVNNHQGSLLTQLPQPMQWLMEEIEARPPLYFVDSRTHAGSVAYATALAAGVPATQRQVFLDAERDPEAMTAAWRTLLRTARRDGSALAIAHPYPETFELLERELSTLAAAGVQLVPPSELIRLQDGAPPPTPAVRTVVALATPAPAR